jgi:hypothetical protein
MELKDLAAQVCEVAKPAPGRLGSEVADKVHPREQFAFNLEVRRGRDIESNRLSHYPLSCA